MSDRCYECGSMDFVCVDCTYTPLVAERDALRVRLGTAEELLRGLLWDEKRESVGGDRWTARLNRVAAARAFLSDGAP